MWILGLGLTAMAEDGLHTSGNPVKPEQTMVYSIDNENRRFYFIATLEPGSSTDDLSLRIGTTEVLHSAHGYDGQAHTVYFILDEAGAAAVAETYGLSVLTRSPLGEGLEGSFSAGEWAVGGMQPITLVVKNHDVAVGLAVGGRQRGPRNDRFSFVISQDGVPLETVPAYNFGGPMTLMKMEEGMTHTITVDAADWAAVSEPGEYQVACIYETGLWTSEDHWHSAETPHQTWDLRVEQVITVTVP